MTPNQVIDMKHAVKNGRFYTSADNPDWNDLVEKGFATKRPGWEDSQAYYFPTSEGKAALSKIEQNK